MKCQHCGSAAVVKNGCSRHGRQRWLCLQCHKTCGEKDHRRVEPAKRASALAHYLEGVGLRATERLVGVSHNAVMNWVLAEVAGKALAGVKPDEVEWVEADELWTYAGQKKRPAGSGGLLIVLPGKSAAGRWGSWNRNGPPPGCATSSRQPHHLLHRLLAPLRPDLRPAPPSARQSPHLHHRKPQ